MKKLIIFIIVLLLLGIVVLAKGPDIVNAFENSKQVSGNNEENLDNEDNNKDEEQELGNNQQINSKGESQQLNIQNKVQAGADEIQGIKNRVQEKIRQINHSLQIVDKFQQNAVQNQNQVRVAVHTLLALENFTGGIGKNISAIARNFNNSLQATIRAEERIQARSRITRFFMGGNKGAAEEIEEKIDQNKDRIQELKRLKEECDCDEEILNMVQEQIQNMEQEQNRLQELAQNEKKSKGIFGWLFK